MNNQKYNGMKYKVYNVQQSNGRPIAVYNDRDLATAFAAVMHSTDQFGCDFRVIREGPDGGLVVEGDNGAKQ